MGLNFVELASRVHTTSSFQEMLFVVDFPVMNVPDSLVHLRFCNMTKHMVLQHFQKPVTKELRQMLRRCREIQSDVNFRIEVFND